jgi:amino acid adenylation domain-containing protein
MQHSKSIQTAGNQLKMTFPLTHIQEGMFLETTQASNPGIYLQQIVVGLENEQINHAAMEAAWTDAFTTLPALRLVVDVGDELTQSVHPPGPITVKFLDWTAKTTAQIDTDFADFLATDRSLGTAANQFPSSRFTLIQTNPTEGKLIWTFPHSLLDGRSLAPVLTEAFTRYELHRDDDGFDLAAQTPTSLAFSDHCLALRAVDHGPGVTHFADALAGWEGGSGLLDLEADPQPRAFAEKMLTTTETQALEHLATCSGVPMSTLLMAAWGVVTAHFSGRGDTVFGNTLSGRHLVEGMQDAVGCFLTTVPIRLMLTPAMTVGQTLKDMRAQQINLRPYDQTPLTQVRAKTDVPVGVPMFDTVVVYETTTLDAQLKSFKNGWENRSVGLFEEGAAPITLGAYHGKQIKLVVEYDPAQVPEGQRVTQYLKQFLANLAGAAPETPLAAITMLSNAEITSLRHLSGEKIAARTKAHHCLSLFAQQVAAQPDHPALSQTGTTTLSYAALDLAANRLSNLLISIGISKNDVIGICTSRSPSFAVALLAIWKSGAAFVPMDPTYPKETLDIIETDSGARLILTDTDALTFNSPTLNLSDDPAADQSGAAPRIDHMPDDPAYVIFTSGSTGRPKGVMVSHASLAAHSLAAHDLYDLSPSDRALQFASLSFDVALEEVVSTLMAGATLVMRTPEMSQSTSVFLEECRDAGITLMNLPTGFWVALTDALEAGGDTLPASLRMVIVGGERVPMSVLRRWRAMVPDIAWVNGYGPTETTITCTAHRMTDADLKRTSVPIGKPLGHAAAWVLAADGSLAPEGTEGELWISGPAVAMGYVGRPEITAERFVHPAFDHAAGRSYGTGDRVKWDDKLLNYIGRVDRQIKLRGYRIEPGQIEQVIEGHADIARAHVAVHAPAGGQPRLIAWYSSADPKNPVDAADLRSRVATALPAHMRPEPVHVDHWPQTPGGKIDTPNLPAPVLTVVPADEVTIESPLTLEVAKLFAQILKIDHVPAHTSFFDLGGDSLLLLRLLALIEKEFGVRLKSLAVYSEPTPAGIVKALQKKETDPLVVIPIQPEGTAAPIYAVHVLGNNGSFFRPLAAEMGTDQPIFGLTVGLLSEDTPTSVEDIARFYLHQIERHHPTGPLSLVAVSAGSYVTFELAQQLTAAGREVQALIFLDSTGPGGRERASGLARIGVHARMFARHPSAYIRRTFLNKLEDFQQTKARKELIKNETEGEGEGVQSIAAFVAANALSIEQYTPTPYPGRITIIRAGHDLFDTQDARENGLGWGIVAGGGLDLYDVPGEHLTILEQPYVPELARRIAKATQPVES